MLKQSYTTPTAKTFRTHALQCWPEPQTTQDSGLACLVVVVRHLLSCFPRLLRYDIATSHERTLAGFLQDDPKLVFETLRGVFDQKKPMMFESLIEQSPMTGMLQAHPCFCLGYDCEDPSQISPRSQTHSLQPGTGFEWDGTGKLAEHVAQNAETLFLKETELNVIGWITNRKRPIMIRLKYTSKNPHMRFDSHLRSFSLRNKSSLRDYSRYYAVAVIKLGRSDDDVDSLRLYDEYGNPLEHSRNLDKIAAPWSDHWAIEDEGEYMIYYVRNDSPIIPPSEPLVTASPPGRAALIEKSLRAFQASQKAEIPLQLPSNAQPSRVAQNKEQIDRKLSAALPASESVPSHSSWGPEKDKKVTEQPPIFDEDDEEEQEQGTDGATDMSAMSQMLRAAKRRRA
ncbi:hypothetical protein QBC45DRAFT_417634 [Copromyces sp. CBS 386.78]|nr:hypothetical protein QBC45DRAFT_417634 [Copromyces sp. CBS 386.78]